MPINPDAPQHALYTITHDAETGVTVTCNCGAKFNAATEDRALALFSDSAIPEREVLELAAREAVTKHADIGTAVRDIPAYRTEMSINPDTPKHAAYLINLYPDRAVLTCNCGQEFTAPDQDRAMAAHAEHSGYPLFVLETPIAPAAEVEELPAQMTTWTPEQFAKWIEAPGTIYVVYLPRGKSFIVKVPDEHAKFFTGMMQQLRIQLGPEVQAMSAAPVELPPQPPHERIPDGILPTEVETVPQRPHVPNGPNMRTVELPDDPTSRVPGPVAGRCEGSGKPPKPGTDRNRDYDPTTGALRYAGRGACSVCSGDYRLTNDANIWTHRSTK